MPTTTARPASAAAAPATALEAALRRVPLLPVLRTGRADDVERLAERLVDGGVTTLEVTTTTDGWRDALRACARRWPGVLVGAGTVTTDALAREAVAAGAAFLVSPWPAPAVRAVATAAGVPFVEGGATPGELAAAVAHGPAKLFPAHVGGPALLRSVLAVLPGALVVPTGGVRLADVPAWLEAGALAVGVGSDLAAPGDVAARVAAARSAAGGARP